MNSRANHTSSARSSPSHPAEQAEDAEATPLPQPGEVGRGRKRGADSTSNRGSTSADYLARRIARDRPDLLQRLKAGEFASVRAAAKAVGIANAYATYLLRYHRYCRAFTMVNAIPERRFRAYWSQLATSAQNMTPDARAEQEARVFAQIADLVRRREIVRPGGA